MTVLGRYSQNIRSKLMETGAALPNSLGLQQSPSLRLLLHAEMVPAAEVLSGYSTLYLSRSEFF